MQVIGVVKINNKYKRDSNCEMYHNNENNTKYDKNMNVNNIKSKIKN